MSKKQQIPNTQLSGRNIYTDKKKRVIYYDSLTKQGYLIGKKDEGKIFFFQNRLVIILFAAILCAGTFLDWKQATLAGVALFAIVEVYYRAVLFKKFEVATDVDFGRRLTPLQAIVAKKSREKVLALIALWAVFSILVLVNAYMEQYSLGLMVLSAGLAIMGLYFCVLHIVALTRMK